MAHNNGIITKPINVRADIAYVLGRSTGDVGQLCGDVDANGTPVNRINKWAKYKPVINTLIDTTGQLDVSTGGWAANSDWWKGSDIHHLCGFTIPQYAALTEIIGTDDVWEYLRPTGTHWKRVFDFHQYNHNAERPYTLHLPTSVRTTGRANAAARMVLGTVQTLPQYNLLLTDIGNFSTFYFGIVVTRDNQAYLKTNAYNLGSGSGGDLISLDGCPLISSAGAAEIYAVLTPSAQTTWTNVYERNLWSLNCDSGYGHAALSIIEPAANVYRIVLSGLSSADAMAWGRTTITCSLSGGEIYGTKTRRGDATRDYNLSSVTWKVVKNSDQSTIVRQGTLSSLSGVQQTYLEMLDETQGQRIPFRAPYVVGTLPELADPSDYYVITYTFEYV